MKPEIEVVEMAIGSLVDVDDDEEINSTPNKESKSCRDKSPT